MHKRKRALPFSLIPLYHYKKSFFVTKKNTSKGILFSIINIMLAIFLRISFIDLDAIFRFIQANLVESGNVTSTLTPQVYRSPSDRLFFYLFYCQAKRTVVVSPSKFRNLSTNIPLRQGLLFLLVGKGSFVGFLP